MVLEEQELLQIDEAFLRKLFESNPQALLGLSIKLIGDLKEALERLNQNPSNSSKPSGSQAPWDKGETLDTPEVKDEPTTTNAQDSEESLKDNESSKQETVDKAGDNLSHSDAENHEPLPRNPGKQPGAPGFGRIQKLPVTHVEEHHCTTCSVCNTDLSSLEKAYTGFYTLDVEFGNETTPGVNLRNTHHIYYIADCPGCGLENRREPKRAAEDTNDWKNAGLTEWRLIGPSLAAMIVYLSNNMRISKRLIKDYFHEIFGVDLCIGSIQKSLTESARALAQVEEQLINELMEPLNPLTDSETEGETKGVPDKSKVVFVDETSHPEAGDLRWLWIFMSATTALYLIGKRSRLIFDELLDKSQYEGWLMSDGYGVYRNYLYRLRCWAHLLRKAKGLSESYTASVSTYGKQMLALMQLLMDAIYLAREGPDEGRISITGQHKETLEQLCLLCTAMSNASHKKTRELGREFLNDWDAIFRVLDYPAWPLTNNVAEQGLRHWVILRRITQGTRCQQGSRALAIFASVITTCRLRGSSSLRYIRDAIALRRQGKDVPKLPPIPENINVIN